MLEKAADEAGQLREKHIGIYSLAGSLARIQSPDEFIQSIERIKKRIFTKKVEKYIAEKDENFEIKKEIFSGLKFMHMTIDEEPEPGSEPILASE